MKTVYKNAIIIDHTGVRRKNVLEEDGIITEISGNLPEADRTVDVSGFVLMPGLVDTHSHLRDPGLTYKEDIGSGLKAAAKGGFTTVCAMANTRPVIDTKEKLKKNIKKADRLATVDLIQAAAVTENFGEKCVDFESLSKLTPLFSNDGNNIDSLEVMKTALGASTRLPIIIDTHNEPETETIARDINLLRKYGGRLHISHLSKKDSLDLVRQAKKEGLNISCEVTPHHLYKSGLSYKVHPPFREESDRTALIEGIKDGTVDTIGTDHAPHSQEDKNNGSPGLIGYESAFGIVNKVFSENGLSLKDLSRIMSYNPSKLLNIPGGQIAVGEPASFVIVSPDEKWIYSQEDILSKSHNSPFFGEELLGRIEMTVSHGKEIYRREK